MSDSIKVAIKVRPLIKREKDENLQIQWEVQDNSILPFDPEAKKRIDGGCFQFDHIFDPQKSNKVVFDTVVKPIVDSAVKGFNGTVFAYGQTSSGKTHTMIGTQDEYGIIPLAVDHMFDAIEETYGREFLLRVSYLEIYNEKVNDLLSPGNFDLKLYEDSNSLVQVDKCKEEVTTSPEHILDLMRKGDEKRRTGETDMNERSSRSHTIFRITIESRESGEAESAIQVSQLNLVDLAGSERARQTNAIGERFKEGTYINLSLSTLGLVIKQLSESNNQSNKQYVNFRDSKLTRLLQSSLGGNAMTVMICAVTPAAVEETHCTLSFASRAKSVKNKPKLNEVMTDAALLNRYKKQLSKLNAELESMKKGQRTTEMVELETELQEKENILKEKDKMNQLLQERIELLKKQILSGNKFFKQENHIPAAKRRKTWAASHSRNRELSRMSLLPTIVEDNNLIPDQSINLINFEVDEQLQDLMKTRKTRKKIHSSRKSIIQTVDLANQSFETALEDFEIQLIENAKERENYYDYEEIDDAEIRCHTKNRVKFQDEVEVRRLSSENSPPQRGRKSGSESPGTPKSVLRERLQKTLDDYHSLQEYTTMEKQQFSDLEIEPLTEKLVMKKQIDDLTDLVAKLQSCQAHATVSINKLVAMLPKVFNTWQPTYIGKSTANLDDVIDDFQKITDIVLNFTLEEDSHSYDKEVENTKLMKELEFAKLENERLLNENIELREKLENELEEFEQKTAECNDYIEQSEAAKIENEDLMHENTELKEKLKQEIGNLEEKQNLINGLQMDTECLMNKLLNKTNELLRLQERVVTIERENEEMKLKSCDFDNNSNDSQNTEDKNSNNFELVSNEIQKLTSLLDEKCSEIVKYKDLENQRRLENETLQQTLETLNNRENEASKIIEENVLEIDKYRKLEDQLRNEIQRLQETFLSSITTMSSPNQENSILANKSESMPSNSEEIINLQNENQTLQASLTEALTSRQEIEKVFEDKVIEYTKLQEMHQHLELQKTEELNKLQNEIDKLQQSFSVAIESEEKLRIMLQEKTSEVLKYQELEKKLQIECEKWKQCLESAIRFETDILNCVKDNMKINQYEELEEKLKSEIVNLNQFFKSASNNEKILMSMLKEKYQDIKNFDNIKKQLLSEIQAIKDTLDNSLESEKKLYSLNKENSEELLKYKKIKQDLENQVEELKQSLEKITKSEENLTSIIREKTEEIDQYKITETSLLEEIQNLKSQIHLNSDAQLNYVQVDTIENDTNSKVSITNLEEKIKILESALESVNQSQDASSKLVEEKIVEIMTYKEKQDELLREISSLQENLNITAESEAQLKQQIVQLGNELIEHERFKTELQDKVINLQQSLEIITLSNEKLTQNIEEKTNKLSDYEELQEKLLSDMKSKTEELNSVLVSANEYSKIIDENNATISKQKELEKNLREELEGVKAELDILTESEENLARIVEEKTQEIKKYKRNEEKLLKEIGNLKVVIESKSKLDIIAEESTSEIKKPDLEDQLDQKVRELSELHQQMDILKISERTLALEVEDKTKMVENLKEEVEEFKQYILGPFTEKYVKLSEQIAPIVSDDQDFVTELHDVTTHLLQGRARNHLDDSKSSLNDSMQIDKASSSFSEVKKIFNSTETQTYPCTLEESLEYEKLKEELAFYKEQIFNLNNKEKSLEIFEEFRKVKEMQNRSLTVLKTEEETRTNELHKSANTGSMKMICEEEIHCTGNSLKSEKFNEMNLINSNSSPDIITGLETVETSSDINGIQLMSIAIQTNSSGSENLKNSLDNIYRYLESIKIESLSTTTNDITQRLGELFSLYKNYIASCQQLNFGCSNMGGLLETQESQKSLKLELESSSIFGNESYFNKSEWQKSGMSEMSMDVSNDGTRLPLKDIDNSIKIHNKLQKKNIESDLSKLVHEDINASLMNCSLNTSFCEGINMTIIEEKVQLLHSELQELKENQYNLKYNESGKFQMKNNENLSLSPAKEDQKIVKQTPQKSSSSKKNTKERISKLQQKLDEVSSDIKNMKKSSDSITTELDKYKFIKTETEKENESLKATNEDLKNNLNNVLAKNASVEEKLNNLQSEVDIMQRAMEQHCLDKEKLEIDKSKLSDELENLMKEKLKYQNDLESLQKSFENNIEEARIKIETSDQEKQNLQDKLYSLENLIKQKAGEELGKVDKIEFEKLVKEKSDILQQLEKMQQDFEEQINTLKSRLLNYEKENIDLKNELTKLKMTSKHEEFQIQIKQLSQDLKELIIEKAGLQEQLNLMDQEIKKSSDNITSRITDIEKINSYLTNEIDIRESTIKELESQISNFAKNDSSEFQTEIDNIKKSIINELRGIKKLSHDDQLEFAKKPAPELFKLFINAIQSVYQDITQKIQTDFSKKEKKILEEKQQAIDDKEKTNDWAKTLEADNEKLQTDLSKEEHLNKNLKEKIRLIEDQYREINFENRKLQETIKNLENELKILQNEYNNKNKDSLEQDNALNVVQEKERIVKSKEEELEAQTNDERQEYLNTISELKSKLESYTVLNDELKNTVEGLELNIEHMAKTIDIKNSELETAQCKIEKLNKDAASQEDVYQQLNEKIEEKNKRVEEITNVLKYKCDLLTEYKNKVESMVPEFESLENKVSERDRIIDKMKDENNNMKMETEKQINKMQDELSVEKMKSSGLTKQIMELKNANIVLTNTIEEMKDRYEELEIKSQNLEHKIRNSSSTDKIKAELQSVQDENRALKNQLEGSYNRTKELLDSKNQLQQDYINLETKLATVEHEYNTAKITIDSLREKLNCANVQKLRSNYDILLKEKNSIATELQDKKMILANKEQIIGEYNLEINNLKQKNLQLSTDLSDLQKKLKQNEKNISTLRDEIIQLKSINEKLNSQITDSSFILQDNKGFQRLLDEKTKLSEEYKKEKQKLSDKLQVCLQEKEEIIKKNKELDDEMEDMVKHIHKQESEIAELRDQLITGSDPEKFQKLVLLESENDKLKSEVRAVELCSRRQEHEITQLNSDKDMLNAKINTLENKISDLEAKINLSRNSSMSNSPHSVLERRRQRRSSVFNQNRNIDSLENTSDQMDTDSRSNTPTDNSSSKSPEECNQCAEMRERIQELTIELAERNGKIASLEIKITNSTNPYQVQCKKLRDKLTSYVTRNKNLTEEIKLLKNSLIENSSNNCSVCKHWHNNKRDQAVQSEKERIGLSGMNSGFVENEIIIEAKMKKLESERELMKKLCRERAKKIKDLEQKLIEYEG